MNSTDAGSAPSDAMPGQDPGLPAGFTQMRMSTNPFIDMIGPLYGRMEDERFVLGVRVETRHCNPGGTCHGGMVMTLADMLVVMNAGAVEQVGPPLELYRKPATAFVATFLGAPAMNLMPISADGIFTSDIRNSTIVSDG